MSIAEMDLDIFICWFVLLRFLRHYCYFTFSFIQDFNMIRVLKCKIKYDKWTLYLRLAVFKVIVSH